ncbi:MAG: hypothetical protein KKE83_10970, partial [Proteobacteria bacterium]|nr:hypothetical protein [Pseudomonadota bacterium]
ADEYFETMDDADQKLEISPESVQYHVRRQAAGILITKTIYTKFFTRPGKANLCRPCKRA